MLCDVPDDAMRSHWDPAAPDPKDLQQMWALWASRLYRYVGRLCGDHQAFITSQPLDDIMRRIGSNEAVKGLREYVEGIWEPFDLVCSTSSATAR